MVIKKLRYSGAYKMFIWVAESLAKRGFDVIVFTYMKSDVSRLHGNIKWVQDDLEMAGFVKQIRKVHSLIKEYRPDVCISFLLDANIVNTLACLGTKAQSVICERNDPFKPKYYKLKLTKWIFRWADGAVFQLPKVKEYYSMVKGHTAVIPNPVQTPNDNITLSSFENRKNKIVTLGRIDVEQKRHDVLIQAFLSLHENYPNYELDIYGDGHKKDVDYIQSLINKLNLSKWIHLKGITNSPKEVLSEAKFFVLSSDFEGIPNALIEAMTIGLPCISTDCRPGGAALLLKNKKNGILVPPHDIQQLSEAMLYMATHPEESEAMGKQAKLISKDFSENIIIEKWISYLQQFA